MHSVAERSADIPTPSCPYFGTDSEVPLPHCSQHMAFRDPAGQRQERKDPSQWLGSVLGTADDKLCDQGQLSETQCPHFNRASFIEGYEGPMSPYM